MTKVLGPALVGLLALALPAAAQVQPGPLGPGGKSCAACTNVVLKATKGNFYDAYALSASAGYLYLFNSATAPADGAVTAGTASGNYVDCIAVPIGVSTGFGTNGIPEFFTVGATLVFSSTACGTLTKASATYLKGRAQ